MADEPTPAATDSAYTVAFSVLHRGPEPTREEFMTALLRHCVDLFDGAWSENLDAYDQFPVTTEAEIAAYYPGKPDSDLQAALHNLVVTLSHVTEPPEDLP